MRGSGVAQNLVVINYSMDENDPLLAHQIEAVRSLSQFFSRVTVITSHRGKGDLPSNVHVVDLSWRRKSSVHNAFNFLRLALPQITRRNTVLFSHMTDVQAALVAPFARIFGVRHYQWYAHKTLSKYLKWSSLWVNGIITSTPGSCPISGNKVTAIGQALNPDSFKFILKGENQMTKALHIGRFDPSKNLDLIIQTIEEILTDGMPVTFTQIGNPTTPTSTVYALSIQTKYQKLLSNKKITIIPSIPRNEITNFMRMNDFFIHAYMGSLDKTLIEATLSGIPVLTLNPEYRVEFGTWSKINNPTLHDEFQALKNLSHDELQVELIKRRKHCESAHSLENWTRKLVDIFVNG